jgi:hypothetical protein
MSELVEFKNTVAAHIKQNKIIDDVVEIITKIPDFAKLKMDPEIVNYCCNVVENLIKKEDKKEISKINLVTTILIKVWDLKEETDLDYIIKQIKFVVNNNQVKKISKSKKYKKYVKDWIIRRLS